jgi:hypothetical protein
MMERWKAMPEKPKEIVVEGNVLVHGIAGEVIPNTVKEIGEQAFCCCEELEEIVKLHHQHQQLLQPQQPKQLLLEQKLQQIRIQIQHKHHNHLISEET